MAMRVLLVDDHQIMRDGLRLFIGTQSQFEVAGEAGDGREAVGRYRQLLPDLVIMDIGLPELNGIEATRQIRAIQPAARVLILSMHADRQYVARAFGSGASGYLIKDCSFDELARAMNVVMSGKPYVSPSISGVIIENYSGQFRAAAPARAKRLSDREQEVLQLLAEGKTTKEIACDLHLSGRTIETHRQLIMKKLNLRGVADLTKHAIREGLTSL
ncbi:MAG: response regulator transcription factor [Verrucomicrobiae bacterium]|nr:response regulator transcription factor [Verrucomicrobiae bacterium]